MSEARPRRVLVLGDLSAHITEQIKEALQDNQTEFVMIPDISDDEARRIYARTGEVVLTTSTTLPEDSITLFDVNSRTLTGGGGFGFIEHAEPCQPPASDFSEEDERRFIKRQQQQDRKRFEQQQRSRHKMTGRKK